MHFDEFFIVFSSYQKASDKIINFLNKFFRFDYTSDLKVLRRIRLDLSNDERINNIFSNDSDSFVAVSTNSTQTRLLIFEENEPSREMTTKFKHKILTTTLMEDSRTGQSIQLAAGLSRNISAIDCFSNKEFRQFEGHLGPVTNLKSLQGCCFLSSSKDKQVRLWDIRVMKSVKIFEIEDNVGPTAPVMAVDSSGSCLSLGSATSKNLYSFDISSGRLVSKNPVQSPIKGLGFSNSERILAVASEGLGLADLTQIPARFRQKPIHQKSSLKFGQNLT